MTPIFCSDGNRERGERDINREVRRDGYEKRGKIEGREGR